MVIFGIPLISRAAAKDWSRVMHHLGATLKSLDRQTSRQFCIFVAGTDEPELEPPLSQSFEFLRCPDLAGYDKISRRADGANKRFTVARRARERGGGYIMFVDSDDLVSRHLVSFIEQNPHPSGYLATDGYIFNARTDQIAPYPFEGYEDFPFDQVCGTCAIARYSADDLPACEGQDCAFARIYKSGHRLVRRYAFDEGRPLAKMPFRSVAYVKETQQNLSQLPPRTKGADFHDALLADMPDYAAERTPQLEAEFSLDAARAPCKAEPANAEAGTVGASLGF